MFRRKIIEKSSGAGEWNGKTDLIQTLPGIQI